MTHRLVLARVLVLGLCGPAAAQQRPLVTEDPETIGAGRVLLESGVDFGHEATFPVSGLSGDLWRVPTLGVSTGISSIAELQIDGSLHDRLSIANRKDAPLSGSVTSTGDVTTDVGDITLATKIRVVSETSGRPAFGLRFATKLPNASNESGLGTDTMDFHAVLLAAKTIQSIRLVGNMGVAIMGDPTDGSRQNDVLLYGVSFARAMTNAAELVGELNGRISTRSGTAFPGTETRGLLRIGGRFTHGPVRIDGAIFFGLTSVDPSLGFTGGVTWVFNGFTVP